MTTLRQRPVILLHGYGVRGDFWDPVAEKLRRHFPVVEQPNMDMRSPTHMVEFVRSLARTRGQYEPVALVGHSMGCAAASVVAMQLGTAAVARVASIAPSFGGNRSLFKGLTKFLIRHQLIPDSLTMPQFFNLTEPAVRKMLWQRSVPESRAMLDEVFSSEYFHTRALTRTLFQPSLVIASEADQITPVNGARAFAEATGGTLEVYGKERQIGHDDFVWAPSVAEEIAERITAFCGS